MVTEFDAYNLLDFTGGLNLEPDVFKLSATESPEMLNVDISHRGGVTHRDAFKKWADADQSGTPIVDLHTWTSCPTGPCVVSTSTEGVVREHRHSLTRRWSDQFPDTDHSESQWRETRSAAEFGGELYLAAKFNVIKLNGLNGAVEYDLPMIGGDETHFNNDLDNPVGGKFPAATVVAAWQGSMWAANIREDTGAHLGDRHPNRLRWSHLNYPEDWHADHYIDIEDDDSGEITALIPDGDRLLVFRERGIHAVIGSPPEAVAVYQVSDVLGCQGPNKVAQTPHGVYFWSADRGLHVVGQQTIEWAFEKLYPALATGHIDGRNAVVSWGGDRVYVKLEYSTVDGADQFRSWFVLDPSLGKSGAWTRHGFAGIYRGSHLSQYSRHVDMPAAVWFAPADQDPVFVAAVHGALLFRSAGDHEDEEFMGATARPNMAVFRTAWLDLGQPGRRKRWRRADVIGSGLNAAQPLTLTVFRDYDSWRPRRDGEVFLSDTTADVYGTAKYGTAVFSGSGQASPVIARTPPLGLARSVQLLFVDETVPLSLDWSLNSLVVKYTPYRVRK